jgi:hypothetical protein
MEKKYKVAVILSFIPALINIAVLAYGISNFEKTEFTGYSMGTILAVILSIIWLIQARRAVGSHAIKLFKITLKGLLIKFVVFFIFIISIYYYVDFNRKFFAASFFLALFIGAVIELWFYSSMNKET